MGWGSSLSAINLEFLRPRRLGIRLQWTLRSGCQNHQTSFLPGDAPDIRLVELRSVVCDIGGILEWDIGVVVNSRPLLFLLEYYADLDFIL